MFFWGQDDRTPLKAFNYQHSGEIIFGNGAISKVGSIVSRYGQRCLIVSGPHNGALRDLYPIVGELLEHLGLEWEHFEGVNPNPTVDLISTGAKLAKKFRADVILGIGGGSSLDTAKAIALETTHQGTCWDCVNPKQQPSARTLPVVAVGTTAGSGSQVNPVAIISFRTSSLSSISPAPCEASALLKKNSSRWLNSRWHSRTIRRIPKYRPWTR